MWRSIRVIRNLYERFQNALGKMYGLWIRCVIIKDPLVGMLKFCQAPLVLSSNFTFSSTARMSYRHVYLTGSETQNSLSPCVQDPSPTSRLLPAYFSYWHWHLLDWETLKTSPFMFLTFFPHLQPINIWKIQCRLVILSVSNDHPRGRLHKLSHFMSIPSCQGNPYSNESFGILLPQFLSE